MAPTDFALLGIALLIASAVAVVIEAGLAALWSLRIARHSQTLNESLQTERASLQADLDRLRAALEETKVLWEPYRRLFRWIQHPLLVALLQSLARRLVPVR